jgi:hypothetical protein
MLVGEILKHYYQSGRTPLRFKEVELKTLKGLTDQDPKRFQKDGLRNLVRTIAAEARHRSAEHLIINATEGYKAQISFAGMIGQALGIPVCYMFENFDTVIELPPQPISLDLSFWLNNAFLFYELADYQVTLNPSDQEPLFATLVDTIEIDGVTLLGLSSMGQLFHETFCYRFLLQQEALVPPEAGLTSSEKAIRYEKGIGIRPPGIEHWLGKLLEVSYIKGVYTHCYSPQLQRPNYFRPSSKGIASQIEGGFSDGKAMIKFDLITTATTEAQRNAAVVDLSERFLAR